MSEETDALNARIRQLENQVADMQRLVQDTSDLLDIARANGLDKFLTGHGFWETQGGTTRFDTNGMQINAPASTTSISWVDGFQQDPLTALPRAGISANIGQQTWKIFGVDSGNGESSIQWFTNGNQGVVRITATTTLHTDFTTIEAYSDGTEKYVKVRDMLWLGPQTSDLSTLQDGEIWYRSDTDKFRARANGVTENLATESYVAANAPTGFADHFLVMGG